MIESATMYVNFFLVLSSEYGTCALPVKLPRLLPVEELCVIFCVLEDEKTMSRPLLIILEK